MTTNQDLDAILKGYVPMLRDEIQTQRRVRIERYEYSAQHALQAVYTAIRCDDPNEKLSAIDKAMLACNAVNDKRFTLRLHLKRFGCLAWRYSHTRQRGDYNELQARNMIDLAETYDLYDCIAELDSVAWRDAWHRYWEVANRVGLNAGSQAA